MDTVYARFLAIKNEPKSGAIVATANTYVMKKVSLLGLPYHIQQNECDGYIEGQSTYIPQEYSIQSWSAGFSTRLQSKTTIQY